MNLNWDNEKSLELISEFKTREILWDSKNSSFYNQSKKEEAWRDLGQTFGLGIDEIKRKVESLRGSFRREKNRMKKKNWNRRGMYV